MILKMSVDAVTKSIISLQKNTRVILGVLHVFL